MFNSRLETLRIIGFLEGCSFLLLGLTMILKYQFAMPKPNYIVGMAHGVLFILYVLLVLMVGFQKKWKFITIFWALLASLVPFGTFVADKMIFKRS